MTFIRRFVVSAFMGGLLVLLPLYLSILLILKVVDGILALVRPAASVLPEWMPYPRLLAIAALVVACVVLGIALRVSAARLFRDHLERWLLEKLPGYALFRSVTQRFTGASHAREWKPALAEIDDGLVPVFIVEEVDARRVTVFVPSAPTPLAGSVRVLAIERVHPIDVTFTQAVKAISQWGSGTRELVAAMRPPA